MSEEIPPTRSGFQKLFAPPVPVKIYLKYEKKDSGWEPSKDESESLDAWLHPLDAKTWATLEAVGIEGFRHFIEKGGNTNDSVWLGNRIQGAQQVMLAVKVSEKDDAKPLFEKELEVLQLETIEIDRILMAYNEAFVPNRAERKNSLRERLGQG